VVQLYIRDVEASVTRPLKQLLGFERITLEPGESKTVSFILSAKDLSFWDTNKKAFIVEPGEFEVMIGKSSCDIVSRGSFIIY
jgi:beta-glucosidase